MIRKCIQEPVEDIMKNEKSDVIVSYEIKRSGRKIVGVQLYFSNRKVNYDSEYLQNDFKSFKNSVLKNYRGKFIVQGVNGYEIHTKFYLNEDGLIVNGSNNKVLNSDAAFSVWSFLYKNQELLGKTLSVEEILLRKYKYRLFELNGEDFSLIDIENSKAENSITIVIENKDKKIGRIFDIKIENFQNFQWKG